MTEEAIIEKRTTLLTLGNLVTVVLLILGAYATIVRFTQGLSSVSALDDYNPWGIWIWFKLVAVCLAGAGYATCAAVYIFGMKRYHSVVRMAVLLGLLGYTLFGISLVYDLGRPWRLPYPFFVSQGTTSIMFEIGLCVAFYLTVLFLEFLPAPLEWLGFRRFRNIMVSVTILLTIFGIMLSTLHQSSLGALYMAMQAKLHPLWYSGFQHVYFFIASAYGGLSAVILVGWLVEKYMPDLMDETYIKEKDDIVFGFGKATALILVGYFFIRLFGISTDNSWHLLASGWGVLFIIEMIGGFIIPSLMFAVGAREKNVSVIRWASLLTICGIIFNKFNISTLAFNWQLAPADRYFPSGLEIILTLFIITLGVTAFRIIVHLMPVLSEHKDYKHSSH